MLKNIRRNSVALTTGYSSIFVPTVRLESRTQEIFCESHKVKFVEVNVNGNKKSEMVFQQIRLMQDITRNLYCNRNNRELMET